MAVKENTQCHISITAINICLWRIFHFAQNWSYHHETFHIRSYLFEERGKGSVSRLFWGDLVGEESVFGVSFVHQTDLKNFFA